METWREADWSVKIMAFRKAEVGTRWRTVRNRMTSIQVIGLSSKLIWKLMAQSSKIESTKQTNQYLQWSTKSNLQTIWTSPWAAAKGKEEKRARLSQGNFKWCEFCRRAASSAATASVFVKMMGIISYLKGTHTSNRGELYIRPFFLADTENLITGLKTHSSLGRKWLPLETICYVQTEKKSNPVRYYLAALPGCCYKPENNNEPNQFRERI